MSNRSELVFVRHGEARSNVTGTLAGPGCAGLTEHGLAAAAAVADRLADMGSFDALHTSTTRRAQQTASVIANRLGHVAVYQTGLRVPDPGSAEGSPWSAFREAPVPDDGETWAKYLRRASTCLSRIVDQGAGRRLVIVGHTETVAAAFAFLLGVTEFGRLRFDIDYTALTIFRSGPDKCWSLFRHNDDSHVPPGLPRFRGHAL
jgi:probable phosphoglycerate mutase